MKKLLMIAIMALGLVSCTNKNVVTDFDPVRQLDVHDIRLLDSLKVIPDGEKMQFIAKYLPNLIPSIKGQVSAAIGEPIQVDSLVFSFGSGKAKDVLDANGNRNNGVFENELICRLYTKETTKFGNPIIIFVKCLNGMIEIKGDRKIGALNCRFEILKGQGLAHHLPALQEWAKAAGSVPVPIRNNDGKVVSHETYLNYLGKYESVLFPGDVIDMCSGMVYNQAGQEVQFGRRLEESRKANAKIDAEKKAKELAAKKAKNKRKLRK